MQRRKHSQNKAGEGELKKKTTLKNNEAWFKYLVSNLHHINSVIKQGIFNSTFIKAKKEEKNYGDSSPGL